jgi:hypothetical protein
MLGCPVSVPCPANDQTRSRYASRRPVAVSSRTRRRGAEVSWWVRAWCGRDGWLHGCGARRTACCRRGLLPPITCLLNAQRRDGTTRDAHRVESAAEQRRGIRAPVTPTRAAYVPRTWSLASGQARATAALPQAQVRAATPRHARRLGERAASNKDRARLPASIPPFPPVPPTPPLLLPPRAPLRLLRSRRKKGKPLRRDGTGLPSRYVRGDPISLPVRLRLLEISPPAVLGFGLIFFSLVAFGSAAHWQWPVCGWFLGWR